MNDSNSSDEENSESECADSQYLFVTLLKNHKILLCKSQKPDIKEKKTAALTTLAKELSVNTGKEQSEAKIAKKIANMKKRFKEKFDKNKTGNKKMIMKPWEELFGKLLHADENPVFNRIPGAMSAGISQGSASCEVNINSLQSCTSALNAPCVKPGALFSKLSRSSTSCGVNINSLKSCSAKALKSTSSPSHLDNAYASRKLQCSNKVAVKVTNNECLFGESEETKNLSTSQLQRLVLLEQLKLIRMQQKQCEKKGSEISERLSTIIPYRDCSTTGSNAEDCFVLKPFNR